MVDFEIAKDDLEPPIPGIILTNGVRVPLTTATGVRFIMWNPVTGVVKVAAAAVVTNAAQGEVEYRWALGDTDTPGVYSAEWEITWPVGRPQTWPPKKPKVSVGIYADGD
jgi:hypothetical protein